MHKHGFISDSDYARQKREVRARKRDPLNAPPRRKNGPAPGTPKNRLCTKCRTDLRHDLEPSRKVKLPFGEVEHIRRRMLYTVRQLVDELNVPERILHDAIRAVMSNDLAPPKLLARSVSPASMFGQSEATIYLHHGSAAP